MKTLHATTRAALQAAIAIAIVVSAGSAFARDPVNEAAVQTPQTPAQVTPTDTRPAYLQRPIFVDTRFTDQLAQMREAARERFINAGKWLEEAKNRRVERKGQVEIKKREIDTIQAKLKLAKKAGTDQEKADLESEKKIEQEHLDYLKQLESLEAAAEKRWSAAKNTASLEDGMHGLQLDLAAKRAQRDASMQGQAPTADRAKLEQETRELVRKTLESMKKAAAARKDLAGKEGEHIEHQLRVLKAWVELTPAS